MRTDWHKKIRLGRGLKKKQKWHGAKGRHNKLRLNRKGHSRRPKIGWSLGGKRKEVGGRYVCNLKDFANVKKSEGIVIGVVGLKKRKEIVAKANEMGILILNKYKIGSSSRSDGDLATCKIDVKDGGKNK